MGLGSLENEEGLYSRMLLIHSLWSPPERTRLCPVLTLWFVHRVGELWLGQMTHHCYLHLSLAQVPWVSLKTSTLSNWSLPFPFTLPFFFLKPNDNFKGEQVCTFVFEFYVYCLWSWKREEQECGEARVALGTSHATENTQSTACPQVGKGRRGSAPCCLNQSHKSICKILCSQLRAAPLEAVFMTCKLVTSTDRVS